jgi:hypothetical protein
MSLIVFIKVFDLRPDIAVDGYYNIWIKEPGSSLGTGLQTGYKESKIRVAGKKD